jgi:hypothetical protein
MAARRRGTMLDYNRVVSLSAEEFKRLTPSVSDLRDESKFTRSNDEDIAKMERLLDLREGALAEDQYYLQRVECGCGRLLTMYDFVFTGLVDAEHSKSLVVHTFVGDKFIVNAPRRVRGSECARITDNECNYKMDKYSCSTTSE